MIFYKIISNYDLLHSFIIIILNKRKNAGYLFFFLERNNQTLVERRYIIKRNQ